MRELHISDIRAYLLLQRYINNNGQVMDKRNEGVIRICQLVDATTHEEYRGIKLAVESYKELRDKFRLTPAANKVADRLVALGINIAREPGDLPFMKYAQLPIAGYKDGKTLY